MKPSTITAELPSILSMRRPIFMWGKSGIGKSSLVHQYATAHRLELRDVRMSQLDSIDLRGFPMPNVKERTMEWLSPNFLPTKKDKPGILFLDEMNGAMPAVMAPSYQLILDGRIGHYIFPDTWAIIAAGNNVGDRGVTHQMPAPLNNRFIHIDVDTDTDDWHARAMADGIDMRIRAYLRLKPGNLHVFDTTVNPRSFPTPRSWYFVDQILKLKRPAGVEFELLKGTVGEGAAGEFTGFCRDIANMPDIDSILLDPTKAELPKTQSVMHAVTTALVDKVAPAVMDRIMKYVTRLPREIQVVFVRGAQQKDRRVVSVKSYMDWCIGNQDIVL